MISGVQPGSPAEKAGLEPGDVVIEFNGEKIRESSELRLMSGRPKNRFDRKAQVIRDGKPAHPRRRHRGAKDE